MTVAAQLEPFLCAKSKEMAAFSAMRFVTAHTGHPLPASRRITFMFCRVAGVLLHAGKNVSFRGFFIVAGRAKVPRGLSEPGCMFTGMGVMAKRAVACIDGAMFEQSAHDIAVTLKTSI